MAIWLDFGMVKGSEMTFWFDIRMGEKERMSLFDLCTVRMRGYELVIKRLDNIA
ncbi:hypothetical protein F2Q69_00014847 [Brassica cretica]|uniref:Uncharacterized protein n=1 Tax=Brassica cretica TaxID=69181 RepID=A0A8S9QUS2_BRACR|nr:hypothetical protein F2Q69_00014847 [Brassica cretica]